MTDNSQTIDAAPETKRKPLLFVLSGPSGVGKDAVLNYLKTSCPAIKFVTTMTTRARRPNEKDGIDYHFVGKEEFERLLKNDELLEWAKVYDNFYGVSKEAVRQPLQQGFDVMVKVDIQGAAAYKNFAPEAVLIFLAPPSFEELAARLKQRYTETPESLATRLNACAGEMAQLPKFDYAVVNHRNQIERAVNDIKAIITAEKCRVSQREVKL
jgi:guanylate kinase